jgi:ABC-type transport system involved in cytochrome c biogenesis ATPase subunit
MRNGAGKIITVRILATLLRPDGGHAAVLGHDVVREAAAVRRRIALAGQAATVDEDLTGRENLLFPGRLSGLSRGGARARAAGLLEAFGLAEAGGKQVKTYSGGMRRRLDLAASFVVPAELYFLDEPTTGLDPAARPGLADRALGGRVRVDGAAHHPVPGRGRPAPGPGRGHRPGAWTATLAFGYRALLKIRHVPEQLFDVIAIPVVSSA